MISVNILFTEIIMSSADNSLPASRQALSVLFSSTFAFTVCFAIWTMFSVLGVPLKADLNLNETQFGLLIATPVLTGSLIRVPLGMLTDRFGGRIVFFLVLLVCVPPLYLMAYAVTYTQFLVLALFVGLAGGTFSVGTPYVARWFSPQRRGFAMGVFGAGNSGSALNMFVAPLIIGAFGWAVLPQVYAALMLGTAILFWLFSHTDPAHRVPSNVGMMQQLSVLKDPRVWRYCQYYSVVFGGYVALALWITKYYVSEYGFDLTLAAFLAMTFSLPGGVLRALGGWFSDRFGAYTVTWWVMWVCWVCFFILSYPQTQMTIQTLNGPVSVHIGLNATLFTALLFVVGVAMAIGKASVFKFISDDYSENIGAVSGVVGLAGGLGGFVLPIMFGVLLDLTGVYSSAFMLLYGSVCVSLIFMHYSYRHDPRAGTELAESA